jgi:orotidine-5'-phosphate decarboxylase
MNFLEKYNRAVRENESLLCVGLDSDSGKLPECLKKENNPVLVFNREIIAATKDIVCAYKPNAAFYESAGREGAEAWEAVTEMAGEIPVIADVKRGDIGNTAAHYAKALFERNAFDAATLNPLMGKDTVEPFLKYEGVYLFLLGLTSNASAGDFEYTGSLYKKIAKKTKAWNEEFGHRLGLVAGATKPKELKKIRAIASREILLIPGIGAQGGNIRETVKAGFSGKEGNMIINVSRAVLFAGSGPDFAEKARQEALRYREMINEARRLR